MSILGWVPIQVAIDTEMSKRVTNGVSCWVSGGEICNSKVKPRWFWMITVLSILIEAIQYIGKLGMCDIGVVVTNTIGGLVRLGIWKLGKVVEYRVR